jgi:hypothetical protein
MSCILLSVGSICNKCWPVETKSAVISHITVDEPVISYLCFECECCWCFQGVEPDGKGCVCVLILGYSFFRIATARGVVEIYQSFGGRK